MVDSIGRSKPYLIVFYTIPNKARNECGTEVSTGLRGIGTVFDDRGRDITSKLFGQSMNRNDWIVKFFDQRILPEKTRDYARCNGHQT